MESDAAYEATMRTLCHVYSSRDGLLAACCREESMRSRYLLTAAALWKTSIEAKRALQLVDCSSHEVDALARCIAKNADYSLLSSYTCYCNAGFGNAGPEHHLHDVRLASPPLPKQWDSELQSVGQDGEDEILALFQNTS